VIERLINFDAFTPGRKTLVQTGVAAGFSATFWPGIQRRV